ncbi:unnamed protein product [Scytosiphon promiscuus]
MLFVSSSSSQLQETEIASSGIQRTYQETNLHLFAENGNVGEVNRCLAAGEMVDKRNTRRQTALHSACAGGHREVADILISQGADLTAKDDQLTSILHCAASGGNADIVRTLLSAGAVVNARDDRSNTPLHSACMRGHVSICDIFAIHSSFCYRILVEAGADTVATDCRKRSPADVIGAMGYVKQDISKAIKAIMNGASGGFREQAADLKREKERLLTEVETTAKRLHFAEEQLENADQEISQLKRQIKIMEEEMDQLRQAAREKAQRNKKKKIACTVM